MQARFSVTSLCRGAKGSKLVVPPGLTLGIYVVDNFGRDRTEQANPG
jgi:hypothetical protein